MTYQGVKRRVFISHYKGDSTEVDAFIKEFSERLGVFTPYVLGAGDNDDGFRGGTGFGFTGTTERLDSLRLNFADLPAFALQAGNEYLVKVTSDLTPTRYDLGFDLIASDDGPDAADFGNNPASAQDLTATGFQTPNITRVAGLVGASLNDFGGEDWYRFQIDPAARSAGDAITLRNLDGADANDPDEN